MGCGGICRQAVSQKTVIVLLEMNIDFHQCDRIREGWWYGFCILQLLIERDFINWLWSTFEWGCWVFPDLLENTKCFVSAGVICLTLCPTRPWESPPVITVNVFEFFCGIVVSLGIFPLCSVLWLLSFRLIRGFEQQSGLWLWVWMRSMHYWLDLLLLVLLLLSLCF